MSQSQGFPVHATAAPGALSSCSHTMATLRKPAHVCLCVHQHAQAVQAGRTSAVEAPEDRSWLHTEEQSSKRLDFLGLGAKMSVVA